MMHILFKGYTFCFLILFSLTWSGWDSSNTLLAQSTFEESQLTNSRVRLAKLEKERMLEDLCAQHGIDYHKITNVFLRAFKQEKRLELWVQGDYGQDYVKVKDYAFCMTSGVLGPKKKRGDLQIPEGFYFISRFNPNSSYHLSLGINYPNPADSKTSDAENLGGDIYIHGECVTVGCIPLTNDKIKEVYLFTMKARGNGQKDIPIHIFPFKFDENIFSIEPYSESIRKFWNNLEEGFYYFAMHRRPPYVHINPDGSYDFF